MKHKRLVLAGSKVAFALLGLSSIIIEIVTLVERGTFNPANFFSFFTVLSNLFAAMMLIMGAVFIYKGRASRRLDMLRGAATLYMVMTGVVFAVLLSNLDPRLLTAVPWDNTVLHYIMPIVLLIDWIVDPPASAIGLGRSIIWLAFPLIYVMYSLVRGAMVGWYPYPFLNPQDGGYGSVLLTSFFIMLFTVSAGILLTRLGNYRSKA